MPAVVIPRLLRDTFGDDVSESLVDFFNELLANSRQETIIFVEEKFERRLTEDLARLDKRITEEIGQLRQEMVEGNAQLRQEMVEGNAQLRQEMVGGNAQLRTEMANVKAELSAQIADYHARQLRWMFVFWIGQVGVIVAILLALLK